VHDFYAENYSFLPKSESKKAGIPVVKKRPNDIDIVVTATRKGKVWGSALRNTAKNHSDILRQKGLGIDEHAYRQMFADGLGEAERSGNVSIMFRAFDLIDEKPRACFGVTLLAFVDD